jgi:hypothetical protein
LNRRPAGVKWGGDEKIRSGHSYFVGVFDVKIRKARVGRNPKQPEPATA